MSVHKMRAMEQCAAYSEFQPMTNVTRLARNVERCCTPWRQLWRYQEKQKFHKHNWLKILQWWRTKRRRVACLKDHIKSAIPKIRMLYVRCRCWMFLVSTNTSQEQSCRCGWQRSTQLFRVSRQTHFMSASKQSTLMPLSPVYGIATAASRAGSTESRLAFPLDTTLHAAAADLLNERHIIQGMTIWYRKLNMVIEEVL
jgi:hypothetical protein